jgi:hypothetical protein
MLGILASLAAAVACASTLAAQESAADSAGGELVGVVLSADADTALIGAELAAPGLPGRAVTDWEGRFRLSGLPPGEREFTVRLPGLPATTFRTEILPHGPTELVLRLSTRLVPRPALEVSVEREDARAAKLEGFYRRRARGLGEFLDRDAITRRRPREVSDLLRGVPGVIVIPGAGTTGDVVMRRSAPLLAHRDCRVGYFVDGIRIPPSEAFRLDELAPDDLEAIEIYRGVAEVPPIFLRTGEECGVVAVWTRDPSGGP